MWEMLLPDRWVCDEAIAAALDVPLDRVAELIEGTRNPRKWRSARLRILTAVYLEFITRADGATIDEWLLQRLSRWGSLAAHLMPWIPIRSLRCADTCLLVADEAAARGRRRVLGMAPRAFALTRSGALDQSMLQAVLQRSRSAMSNVPSGTTFLALRRDGQLHHLVSCPMVSSGANAAFQFAQSVSARSDETDLPDLSRPVNRPSRLRRA